MFNRPSPPSTSEIQEALDQIQQPDALCYVDVQKSNEGLASEISFNVVAVRTASGSLEIALREALLSIQSPQVDAQWRWSETFRAEVEKTTTPLEITDGRSDLESRSRSADASAGVKAKANFTIFGKGVEGHADAKIAGRREHRADATRSRQEKHGRVQPHVRVGRQRNTFQLQFDAWPYENLNQLNFGLKRLPLLDVPEPASVDLNKLEITLRLTMDASDPVRHAFHIRQATGAWRGLASDKRRVVGEILLSKFLGPAHEDQTLWPKANP